MNSEGLLVSKVACLNTFWQQLMFILIGPTSFDMCLAKGGTWLLESFGSGSLEVAIENGTLQQICMTCVADHGGLAGWLWCHGARPGGPRSVGSAVASEMKLGRWCAAGVGPPIMGRWCAAGNCPFAPLLAWVSLYSRLLQAIAAIACYCCLFVCLVKVQHGAAIDIQFNFRL